MLALVICCCMIAVGYFSIITRSVVEGRVKFQQGTWSVKFTDIKTDKVLGNAGNYKPPELSNYVVSFYTLFKTIGDSVTYDVEVTNSGTFDAKLANIQLVSKIYDAVDFDYDGIQIGDVLKAGDKKKFKVTVTYSHIAKIPNDDEKQMQLLLDWIQAD